MTCLHAVQLVMVASPTPSPLSPLFPSDPSTDIRVLGPRAIPILATFALLGAMMTLSLALWLVAVFSGRSQLPGCSLGCVTTVLVVVACVQTIAFLYGMVPPEANDPSGTGPTPPAAQVTPAPGR